MPGLNFLDTYTLIALIEQRRSVPTFFRDRYFKTEAEDIFTSNKVITEYKKNGRKMAPFVSSRIGDIPVDREGFSMHEYMPARIAPSRMLTVDELEKRNFGEAINANVTAEQRAARLNLLDLQELSEMIDRREEWMCVQTMMNNACTMQEMVDGKTKGEKNYVQFFDNNDGDHLYTVDNVWNSENGKFIADVTNICRMLSKNGNRAADLLLGTDVADAILEIESVQKRLDKNSGIITGKIEQELSPYAGIAYMGYINFGGYKLNLISVDEEVEDENGNTEKLFPSTSAIVTAPGCGHMLYGSITQIDHGETMPTTHAGTRVPKFVIKEEDDIRKLRVAARPLAAPKTYCPYIYAANVVG